MTMLLFEHFIRLAYSLTDAVFCHNFALFPKMVYSHSLGAKTVNNATYLTNIKENIHVPFPEHCTSNET